MKYKIYQNGKEITGQIPFPLVKTEGAGIFESMRAYRGGILHEDKHLARLVESAKTIGCQPLPDPEKLRREVRAAIEAFGHKECYVRLTVWEGIAFVTVGFREHPREIYQKGVVLKTASFPRGGPNTFPWQAKASAYQQAVLASTEPHGDAVYEWVFLNSEGFLTESRTGNFFIVRYGKNKDTMLRTPPAPLILNGVTRQFVIKCALGMGFRIQEAPLTRHEFFNADEAFLCNTSWEILPSVNWTDV